MIDISTLHRGEDNRFYVKDGEVEYEVDSKFPVEEWNSPEVFNEAGIVGYEPMTAKELETEEVQDERLNDSSYYLEEKFDGTRALVYFLSQQINGEDVGYCRVFSRRISKKTGFYVENSDSLPQLREIDTPEFSGTILDGEMFINGLPFKEVSSTLNCLWDKAIDRQIEKGFITFHAFDILFYKGIDLRRMPLERRKKYLHIVVEECGSPFIEEVKYYNCGENIPNSKFEYTYRIRGVDEIEFLDYINNNKDNYPNLYKSLKEGSDLTPRAYYELIVATGGEGLIVKPKLGRYHHKRGWEYSKIKKFLTRELIVMGFDAPTKEYTGKDIKKWSYWVDSNDKRFLGTPNSKDFTPVTKFYFYNQVGNLLLGVLISKVEYEKMPKSKRGEVCAPSDCCLDIKLDADYYVMNVCECQGFDESTRDYFTEHVSDMIGQVVEVKANELFRDSGKMRHPRYLRVRYDKEPERCIWSDHIGSSEVTV